MPSVIVCVISWATLALLSAILPRSSKYVLLIVVVATLSTPPSIVVSSNSKHVPTVHRAQLNILGLRAWLCVAVCGCAGVLRPSKQLRRILLLRCWRIGAKSDPFMSCCACETHVVSERAWPWGIL